MKMIALAIAGLLGIGTLAAMPAEAQSRFDRRGYDRGGYVDRGGYRGRDWDRGRGFDRGRGWDSGRGYRWNDRRGYGRPRVRCRIVRGYYGPEPRCFRR